MGLLADPSLDRSGCGGTLTIAVSAGNVPYPNKPPRTDTGRRSDRCHAATAARSNLVAGRLWRLRTKGQPCSYLGIVASTAAEGSASWRGSDGEGRVAAEL